MAPQIISVDSLTTRLQRLLQIARSVKEVDTIDPRLPVPEFVAAAGSLLTEQIKNRQDHDDAAQTAARHLLHSFVSTTTIDQAEFVQVWNLLDIVQIWVDRDQCEAGLALLLIEELLDSQSIIGCKKVFDYLESRRERLIQKEFVTEDRSRTSLAIIVLRFCTQLLRRLSRAEDAVFCGRVFIFLFRSFILGDRSSVNLRGVFHTDNVTTYEVQRPASDPSIDAMDVDSKSQSDASLTKPVEPMSDVKDDDQEIDLDSLYPTFWKLQQDFSDPLRLFVLENFDQFKNGLEASLKAFKKVPKVIQAMPTELKRGVKRKQGDGSGDGFASNYNPKYLTSRDLFELELSELAFQRDILVQALILIDFLLSLTEKAKARLSHINTQRVLQYDYTLTEQDAEWALGIKSEIASYLQEGPDGKFYYRMVDTVLSRDKNWVRWKMESCPKIALPPISPEEFVEAKSGARKACANRRLLAAPLGALDLNFLSDAENTNDLERLKHPSRFAVPSVETFVQRIQAVDLDLEMAMTDEEKKSLQEAKASKTWRTLRVAAKNKLGLFDKIDDGRNLPGLFQQDTFEPPLGDVREKVDAPESRVDGSVAENPGPSVWVQEDQRAGQATSQVTAAASVK